MAICNHPSVEVPGTEKDRAKRDLCVEWRDVVESALTELLSGLEVSERLKSCAQYAVLSGGKRVRPVLLLAVAHDLGVAESLVLPVAIALELLHCASLVHDDLPALDNDTERRGQPTCHVAFGEATAILTGDLLVSVALERAAQSGSALVVAALARTFTLLCDGQARDLDPEERLRDLSIVHRRKTGALFGACFALPAILRGFDSTDVVALQQLGEEVGVAFQVVDDARDQLLSREELGREAGSDVRNQRHTLAQQQGADELIEMVGQVVGEVEQRLAAGRVLSETQRFVGEMFAHLTAPLSSGKVK